MAVRYAGHERYGSNPKHTGPIVLGVYRQGQLSSTIVKTVDKGRFELNENELTLKSDISLQRYRVMQLDSVALSLTATDTLNRTHLYLKRVQ